MTENIFENGGEFCMRGDPEHKPVEWYWFKGAACPQPVRYLDGTTLRSCDVSGKWSPRDGVTETDYDLIPIPSPPQIVPWESPDDVPDGIWICELNTGVIRAVTEYRQDSLRIGNVLATFTFLRNNCEYHTDRRATSGWQPCGKVVQS